MTDSSIPKLFSLQGQTAVVTGGTRGIGQAMAIALAEAGVQHIILVQVTTSISLSPPFTLHSDHDTHQQTPSRETPPTPTPNKPSIPSRTPQQQKSPSTKQTSPSHPPSPLSSHESSPTATQSTSSSTQRGSKSATRPPLSPQTIGPPYSK